MDIIQTQLSTLINMFNAPTGPQGTNDPATFHSATRQSRMGKRKIQIRTPEKIPHTETPLTQDNVSSGFSTDAEDEMEEYDAPPSPNQETLNTSATSDFEEAMEGCED